MLKRSKRIQGKPLVSQILEEGQSKAYPFFVAFVQSNKLKHTRYAVIVPKKLERSAVNRNRKRRQIYEILRLLEKENRVPSEKSFDIILLARKPVHLASYSDLENALEKLLNASNGPT